MGRFFFFKQKTAYEIKECDWSSDVCSSDLDIFQLHCVPGPNIRLFSGLNNVTYIQALRGQDISFLTIGVDQKSDVCRPVGIVLDGPHLGRNIILVPLEIDDSIAPLMPAAPLSRCNTAQVVAPPGFS